jgi:salicylate hydroxylase
MSKKTFQIAIIGGIISGVTLAIGMHKRGIPVTIYEQAHAFGEIGAGVDFSPNAVHAMKLVDKCVYDAFEEVATHNPWESKSKVWFDFLDGTAGGREALKILFSLEDVCGQNVVHRAHFLDAMLKYLPRDIAHFRKHLDDVVEDSETGEVGDEVP